MSKIDFELKLNPSLDLTKLRDMLSVLKSLMEKLGGDINLVDPNQLKKEFDLIDNEIKKTIENTKRMEDAFDSILPDIKKDNYFEDLKGKISLTTKELQKMQLERDKLAKSGGGSAGVTEFAKLDEDIDKATKELKKLNAEYDKYENNTKNSGSSGAKNVQASAINLTNSANMINKAFNFNQVTQMIGTLGDSLNGLTQPFVKLDTAAQKIKTLGGAAAELAPSLRAASLKMSDEVGLASEEILDASYEALSAGIKANEKDMNAFMSASSKLAVGGAETVGNSVNLLSSMLNAYGIEASQTTKVSDILFNTVNLGKTNIKELSASLSGVIPTASAMGIQLDNVGSSLALMTAKGVPTAQATTKLNAMFVEFAKPTAGIKSALEAAGVSMGDFQAKLKNNDLAGALQDVKSGFEKSGKSATESFGSVEASAAFNLLAADVNAFKTTLEGVGNTSGSTEAAYKLMSESVAVKTEAMKNKINNLMVKVIDSTGAVGVFGTTFVGVLGEVGPQITALASMQQLLPEGAFKKANDLVLRLIPAFGAMTTSSAVAGTTATAAGTATGTAWGVALGPLTLVIAAVGLVIAVFYTLYTKVESFRNMIDGFVKVFKYGFERSVEVLQKFWSVLMTIGEAIFTYLTIPFRMAWSVVSGIIGKFTDLTGKADLATIAINFLGGAFDWVLDLLTKIQAGFAAFTAGLNVIIDSISGVIVKILKGDIVGAVQELAAGGSKAGKAFNDAWNKEMKKDVVKDSIAEQTQDPIDKLVQDIKNMPKEPKDGGDDKGETKTLETQLQIATKLYENYKNISKASTEERETSIEKLRIEQKREKNSIDEIAIQQRKITGIDEEITKYKEIFKVIETSDGEIKVNIDAKPEEKKKILNDYKSLVNLLNNEKNQESQLKIKVGLDEASLKDAVKKQEIDRLKFQIGLGIKPQSDILPYIEEDIKEIQSEIAKNEDLKLKLETTKDDWTQQDQAYYASIIKKLVDLKNKETSILTEFVSVKKSIYQDEMKELETKHNEELDEIKRRIEEENKLKKLVISGYENSASGIVDKKTDDELGKLEEQKDSELITELEYNRRKEDIEAEHQRKLMLIKESARGMEIEAQRKMNIDILEAEKTRLELERQKATEGGDIEKAKQIDVQLAKISKSIQTEGDLLTAYSGELQSTLSDAFSNIFTFDEEKVKEPFRMLFATIAGAIKQYISGIILEIVLAEIKKASWTGIGAIVAGAAATGLVTSAVNAIVDPVLDGLTSFSTGGRVDEPTIAIVGDASQSRAGTNTEWILRDDQLWLIVNEAVKQTMDNYSDKQELTNSILNEISYKLENNRNEIITPKAIEMISEKIVDVDFDTAIKFEPLLIKLGELTQSIDKIRPFFKESEFNFENIEKLSNEYVRLTTIEKQYSENKLTEEQYLTQMQTHYITVKSFAGGSGFLNQPTLAVIGDAGSNNPEIVLNNPQLQSIINQVSNKGNQDVVNAINNLALTIQNQQFKTIIADVRQATDEINRENNRRKR